MTTLPTTSSPTTLTVQTPTSSDRPMASTTQTPLPEQPGSLGSETPDTVVLNTPNSGLSEELQALVEALPDNEQNLVRRLLGATGRGNESSIVGNTVNPSTINQLLRTAAWATDKTLYNLILLACVTSPNGELREGGLMFAEAWRSIRHPGEGVLKASEAKFLAMNVLDGIPSSAQNLDNQQFMSFKGSVRGNWLSDAVSGLNGDPNKITLTQLGQRLPEGRDWWGLAGTVASGIVGATSAFIPVAGPWIAGSILVGQVPRLAKQWNQNTYLEKLRAEKDSNKVISFLLAELEDTSYAALAKHLAENTPSYSIASSSIHSNNDGGSSGSGDSEGGNLADVFAIEGSS